MLGLILVTPDPQLIGVHAREPARSLIARRHTSQSHKEGLIGIQAGTAETHREIAEFTFDDSGTGGGLPMRKDVGPPPVDVRLDFSSRIDAHDAQPSPE